MSLSTASQRDRLVRVFFFAAFAVLFYQLFLITRFFFSALLAAGLLTLGFHRLNTRLRRRIRKPAVSALLMTFCVLLTVILPLSVMIWVFLREAGRLLPTVQGVVSEFHSMDYASAESSLPGVFQLPFQRLAELLREFGIHPKSLILENVEVIGTTIASWGGLALENAFLILFKGAMMLVALFFGFRDGEAMIKWIFSLVPMEVGNKATLIRRAYETFWAVAIGVFLTAIAQGLVAMTGFLIAGVRLPVFLGVATAMASLLGSSFIVTIPVALSVWRTHSGWGIFLFVWGLGVVGALEHVLKPILIGSRARMPLVLIFFSIIGGIKAYGLFGIILGPVLVAILLTFIKIYQEQYGTR